MWNFSLDFWYGFTAASGILAATNLLLLAWEYRRRAPARQKRAANAEDTALIQAFDAEVTALRAALQERRVAPTSEFSEATTKELPCEWQRRAP